jgi:hypothetical protein
MRRIEEYRMDPRNKQAQCFYGTLEECLERYGGKSQFTVSAPLTFFSGARLETHRRAESKDGQLVIVERQLGPTSCEVYSIGAKMPPRATGTAAMQSNCA